MTEYKPRNRNDRASRDRHSWSEAFDDHVNAKREGGKRCGFVVTGP